LFRFEGYKDLPVSQVTLKNLTLTLSDTPLKGCGFGSMDTKGAIEMFHAKDCRLENLKVFNVNGHGLKTNDASGITVENCEIFNTGSVGAALRGTGNLVENCLFHHVGQTYNSAIALWNEGRAAVLRHNEIRDVPYDGIMNNAGNSLIENNLFQRCMLVLHDGAAIYSGFSKAVTIRGNVVKDVPDTGGYGSSSYYLDETAEDCVVEDNLSVGVARPAQNHMASNNTLRGNLFVVDGPGKMTLPRCRGYKLEGNVFYASGSWTFSFAEDGIISWPDNIIYSGSKTVSWERLVDYNPNGISALAAKDGTILGDPGLKNPLKGDYTPNPGSPAAKLLKMTWRNAGRTTK
jgi:hypothetical protein